ncbi:MAG: DEAD/DEAH box helicase [Oscillospiraceae bacterium]|nr:DEAD/DEAH box helicase [Oscillospiraceae bacterium]
MFHPLQLTAEEAYDFLTHAGAIEQAGILCRIPNWWKKRTAAVSLSVRLGEKQPSMLGFDTLVSLQPELTADGVPLSAEDIRQLLAQTEGLALLKGKWVEVDHTRLQALLAEMHGLPDTITLMEAMRLGMEPEKPDVGPLVTNGAWLSALLANLKKPESIRSAALPGSFCAQLRPYQENGFTWLDYLDGLGFGACLADDMGLGKTVQVLAYLEKLRTVKKNARALLIVPASLLGNWRKETERFAPALPYQILHGKKAAALEKQLAENDVFLTITTYGLAMRLRPLQERQWDCVILDEAQAIKNPLTKQTREIKKLPAQMRIAITGTPIENDLTNLWSLFDFLNKGLLGTSQEFRRYCAGLNDNPEGYARLKEAVSPFLLRRVKTDQRVIADLPEKLEMVDRVALTKKQAVLYRKAVADAEKRLLETDGIERKGAVLGLILKLKQICNHPDQYLGQTAFAAKDSGKFDMLRELCETIREKRERVLVFTQFREITAPLAAFLTEVFRAEGYVLHGGTRIARRSEIVEAFQGERYVPFVVLSVKAGGTGLNLTNANHVIHFDRWWNPAVENQATDRAYRIGQTKNVMVHKLVCEGTVEEKIDAMIESKRELAENVIGAGSEKWLTELNNDELMQLLRLD